MSNISQINCVSLFHSLGDETVKQEANNLNMRGNNNETTSLKVLASKVLQRNRTGNKYETIPQNDVSSLVLPETKPMENFISPALIEDYEERIAIAEYDGGQSAKLAHRIAYNSALVEYINTHPAESIIAAQDFLRTQGILQPK
jgi:hypothetical protein